MAEYLLSVVPARVPWTRHAQREDKLTKDKHLRFQEILGQAVWLAYMWLPEPSYRVVHLAGALAEPEPKRVPRSRPARRAQLAQSACSEFAEDPNGTVWGQDAAAAAAGRGWRVSTWNDLVDATAACRSGAENPTGDQAPAAAGVSLARGRRRRRRRPPGGAERGRHA